MYWQYDIFELENQVLKIFVNFLKKVLHLKNYCYICKKKGENGLPGVFRTLSFLKKWLIPILYIMRAKFIFLLACAVLAGSFSACSMADKVPEAPVPTRDKKKMDFDIKVTREGRDLSQDDPNIATKGSSFD